MSLLIWAVASTGFEEARSFLRDPAEFYGSRLLIGTLLVALAVNLYSLVKYRGRTNGPAAWATLGLSACVLPSFAVLLGTFLIFERAERVEFCGSCHAAMHTYVADMQTPDSPSLAAVHYRNRYIPRNQCYVCHTSFGLFGTMRAKVAGVEDVRRYYFHSFRQPIRMREVYDNRDCLKCHAGAVRWTGKHSQQIREALYAGRQRCLDCHGKSHPAHVLIN
jgi:cytochrome c nitrite reductase small subunit